MRWRSRCGRIADQEHRRSGEGREAKPGALNYGHQGPLTIPHLAMEEFLTAKIDIKDIPFRGEPLVMTDLLGGRIDVASIVLGTAQPDRTCA